MPTPIKVFLGLSIVWAVIALIAQVISARGGGRADYSRKNGERIRGLIYNFTTAMMPAHKESVKNHPTKFALGLLMHAGVLLVMLGTVLLLIHETTGARTLAYLRPVCAISFPAGLYLFVRRMVSPTLKAMSSPDDYISILASCVLLALAGLQGIVIENQILFPLYAGLLFIYLPLGKLRHAVFFFVARGEYGRRLGYRGVYPPAATGSE